MGLTETLLKGGAKKLLVKIGLSATVVAWPLAAIEMLGKYKSALDYYNQNYMPASRESKRWADIAASLEATEGLCKVVAGYDKQKNPVEYLQIKETAKENLEEISKKIKKTHYGRKDALARKVEGIYHSNNEEFISSNYSQIFNELIGESRKNLGYLRESLKELNLEKRTETKKDKPL